MLDERSGTTFLRKNLGDQITASGAMPKNNLEYKSNIDSLYMQLTKLLNDKVSLHQPLALSTSRIPIFIVSFVFYSHNVMPISILAMKILIQLRNHCFGFPNGLITAINTVLDINYVMKVWALCSMIQPNSLCWPTECKFKSFQINRSKLELISF